MSRTPLPRRVPALLTGALLAAALLLLYRAPALWVWSAWTSDPYYTHGLPVALLALGLAGWALWKARAEPAAAPAWTFAALAPGPALYAAGFARHSPYLMAWSALALAAGIALATGGARRLRALAVPLGLLALCVPTPWTLEAGVWMQGLSTSASAAALRLGGVPLVVDLYTFHAGDITFEVTAACSGFQSAVSLLAVGAVIVALFPMSRARRALVLAAAIPLALLLNVLRILAVVLVGLRWGPAAAEGFFHGWSSGLIFVAETLALLAMAGLLVLRRKEVARAG